MLVAANYFIHLLAEQLIYMIGDISFKQLHSRVVTTVAPKSNYARYFQGPSVTAVSEHPVGRVSSSLVADPAWQTTPYPTALLPYCPKMS